MSDLTVDLTMPCEHCEQGLSNCCRLVLAQDIEDVIPRECWILRERPIGTDFISCTALIGGKLPNGGEWTEELCCLPCRIRLVIERTAKIP